MWLLVALLSPALSALGTYTDKYLLVHHEHTGGIGSVLIFSSLFGALVLPIALIAEANIVQVSLPVVSLLIFNGMLWVGTLAAYLYAIKDSDVVSVGPVLQTAPVFAFILAYITLGESLNTAEFFGSAMIILSALLLSIEIEEDARVRFKTRSLLLAGLSAFLFAVSGTIFKFVAIEHGYWAVQFWEFVGISFSGILLFVCVRSYRKGFLAVIQNGRFDVIALNFTTETLMVGADLLLNFAILLAPIAIVYSVSAFQPAFLLSYALIGSLIIPSLMHKLSFFRKHLLIKSVCIAAMIAGSIVIHTA